MARPPRGVNQQGRAAFSARSRAVQRLLKGPYTSKHAPPPQPDEDHEDAMERIESSRRVLALGWVWRGGHHGMQDRFSL